VDEELVVKPILEDPGAAIEITDLRPDTRLRVKPIDLSVKTAPVSSFETIYDKVDYEDVVACPRMTKDEIMSNLGDRFRGTIEVPDCISSFDELYQISSMDTETTSTSCTTSMDLPGRRWTAPAGSVEAPILAEEEFDVRFAPLVERTESHWGEIERMMGGQSCIEQDVDSSKKIPEQ